MTSAAAGQTAQRVARLLRLSDLAPSDPAASLLVIRRASGQLPGFVPARATLPPDAWGRALGDVVAEARRSAVPMDGRPVPANANAVIFADRAELLARFAQDVAAGTATGWWWQALFRDTGRATLAGVTALWLRHTVHVPAAVAALEETGSAAGVLGALPDGAVARLLRAVMAVHGVPAAASDTGRTRPAGDDCEGDGAAAHGEQHGGVDAAPRHSPTDPWTELPGAPQVPAALPPAVRLLMGVCLMAHRAPLLVRSDTFARRIAVALAGTAAPSTLPGVRPPTRPPRPAPTPEAAGPPLAPVRHPGPGLAPLPLPGEGAEAPADAAAGGGAAHVAEEAPGTPHRRRPVRAAGSAPMTQRAAPPSAPAPAPAALGGIGRRDAALSVHSGLCGVFFLVNALRAERFLDDAMEQYPHVRLASGWGWLELFADALGARALNPADPIWRVLAWLDGRDPAEPLPALLNDSAPRNPAEDPVHRLRTRLRAALAAGAGEGNLGDALFLRPGTLEATRAHVDVHMPLDSVSLPVRLAGLDANPGWAAAYGRVITFHYG